MSLSEKLELLINADPSQGISAMERFGKSADKNVTSAEASFKRFASTVSKIGVAGVGVGGLLTQMASEDIEAGNQLKAAIGQVGQSYSAFADRIDAVAEAQVRFGHTDDEVAGAVTTLTLAYNDTGRALDQMQLATDLAARKHISLGEAASLVAKAHGGAGRVFKEFGITVQQNADGTKDFDGALGQLADKLKGQASASADTFGGRLEALKAQASNVASEFGQKWGPAILGVSVGMTALAPITAGLTKVTKAYTAALVGETAAAEASILVTAGLIAAPLAIGAAFIYGTTHAEEFSLSLAGLKDPVGDVTKNFDKIVAAADLTGTSLYDVGKTMAQDSIPAAEAFADKLDRQGKSSKDVRQAIDDTKAAQEAANAETAAATKLTDANTDSMKNLRDVIKGTDDARKHYADTLKGETDPVFAIIDATDKQADSQRNVMEKTAALNEAVKEHGRKSSEAAKAQDELNQANLDAVKAAGDLTQAQLALEESVRKGDTSVDNARWTMQSWVDQGLITQSQADGIIGRFADLKDKADKLNGTQISIALAFDAQQAEATLKYLLAEKGNFAASAREAANSPGASVSGTYVAPPPTTARRGARAMGGNVYAGSSYLVGELGPEILTLGGTNGYVTPNSALGGDTYNLYGPDPVETAALVSRQKRRNLILSRR